MSFYDSGYVKYLRDGNGEIVRDVDGNPIPATLKETPLIHAINMLLKQNYWRFAVCVPNKHSIYGLDGVLDDLSKLGEAFFWVRTKNRLRYKGVEIDFYFHEEDKDLMRLRGPNYDAAIVKGRCSSDFDSLLSFCLRLGDYPIKVKLA